MVVLNGYGVAVVYLEMLLVRVLRDDLLGRLENINILFPLPDYT
jgi:hypothetical protein